MIILKNLAESFITSAIDAAATQVTVPADHAGNFPSLLAGDNFRCALVNPATEAVEFINVTARNGNVLTITRGEEGTAALPFPVESRIHLRMTARTWEEMAGECWMRPKNAAGEVVLPQFLSSASFTLAGDFTSFFVPNRAVKAYPNRSVGFVESAVFADGLTTVSVIEMTVPADLTHVEAGLDPDAVAKRTLSSEELLGYMTPVPVLEMEALEVDGGTLVSGTIRHPEVGKTYPDSTEFHFNLPDGVTDFSRTGQSFQLRVPQVIELESPKNVGPITCRAAQMSFILSDPSNAVNLSVRYVAVQAGVTLVYADSSAGWPGADVTADGAQLPATTTGLNNPSGKSLVSGTPEVEIHGSELSVLAGTTASTLKLGGVVAQGDVLVTDLGETVVQSIEHSPAQEIETVSHTAGTSPYTCANYMGIKYTATKASFKSISFQGDAMQGAFVTLGAQIWNEDQTVQIAGNGATVNRSSAGWVTLDFAENIVTPGTTYWLIMEFTEHDAAKYWNMVNGGDAAAVLSSARGAAVPLSETMGADWNVKVVEADAAHNTVSIFPALAGAPTKVFKKADVSLKLGAGAAGEYLGPEVVLTWGAGATVSDLVFTSSNSIKDKMYTAGGLHNNLMVAGQDAAVSGVSESINSEASTPLSALATNWLGSSDTVGGGVTVTGDDVNLTACSVLDHILSGPFELAFKVQSLGASSCFGLLPSDHVHTGSENYLFGVADADWATTVFGFYAYAGNYAYPKQGGTEAAGAYTDTSTVFKFKRLADGTCQFIVDNVVKAARVFSGEVKFWASAHFPADPTLEIVDFSANSVLPTVYTTTATLITPLAQAPTGAETVVIPDRCVNPSAIASCVISGSALKYTGTKVAFADPAVKRLALKVSGDASLRAKAAKIYTEEGA
ncbi:hypothetical protein [Maridesulfovibrio sp. FT414]|uniref:hypothetical protein n=1 Tax=Maridesulfovibrio sp. FT414 TaxID=2979469 RepID=UPI003D805D66